MQIDDNGQIPEVEGFLRGFALGVFVWAVIIIAVAVLA